MNQAKCDDRESMTNGGRQPAPQPKLLNQILESTVVLNWKDLTKNAEAFIHVEYHTGMERSIDYRRVWSSTARGYWNLVRYRSVSPDLMSELKFGTDTSLPDSDPRSRVS